MKKERGKKSLKLLCGLLIIIAVVVGFFLANSFKNEVGLSPLSASQGGVGQCTCPPLNPDYTGDVPEGMIEVFNECPETMYRWFTPSGSLGRGNIEDFLNRERGRGGQQYDYGELQCSQKTCEFQVPEDDGSYDMGNLENRLVFDCFIPI